MDSGLRFLYRTVSGRLLLRFLAGRKPSYLAGKFLDSSLSRPLIRPFVEKNGIDLAECETENFACFNDVFTRKLKSELRPVDRCADHLISPCDGLLNVCRIDDNTVLPVKQSRYTLPSLLGDEKTAEMFSDGTCLVFRLCVNHYHRYCYIDDGTKGENRFIQGRLHTVRPVALRARPVFSENCREVCLMETDNFGTVAQIEVGAMLVGKVLNHHGAGEIRRGVEKGMFLYGGSTIILLLRRGSVEIDSEILQASEEGREVPVCMGQRIGAALCD